MDFVNKPSSDFNLGLDNTRSSRDITADPSSSRSSSPAAGNLADVELGNSRHSSANSSGAGTGRRGSRGRRPHQNRRSSAKSLAKQLASFDLLLQSPVKHTSNDSAHSKGRSSGRSNEDEPAIGMQSLFSPRRNKGKKRLASVRRPSSSLLLFGKQASINQITLDADHELNDPSFAGVDHGAADEFSIGPPGGSDLHGSPGTHASGRRRHPLGSFLSQNNQNNNSSNNYYGSNENDDVSIASRQSLASILNAVNNKDGRRPSASSNHGGKNKGGYASKAGSPVRGMSSRSIDEATKKHRGRTVESTKRSLMSLLRQAVGSSFLYFCLIVPISIIIVLRTAEVQAFERDFDSLAQQVVTAINQKMLRTVGAMDGLSVAATSQALEEVKRGEHGFPFVTMHDFDIMASAALDISETALTVGFNPRITSDQIEEWVQYSIANQDWYHTAIARGQQSVENNLLGTRRSLLRDAANDTAIRGVQPHASSQASRHAQEQGQEGPEATTAAAPAPFAPFVWHFDHETGAPGVVPPGGLAERSYHYIFWQSIPLSAYLMNVDMLSTSERVTIIETMEATSEAIWDHFNHQEVFNLGFEDPIREYYQDLLRVKTNDTNATYNDEPTSWFYYPVFENFDSTKVVGSMTSLIYWPLFFDNIFPPTNNYGVTCVVENPCGDLSTFVVNGQKAEYLGPGDLHDRGYDHLVREIAFNDIATSSTTQTFSRTAVKLNNDLCPFTIRIHPTDRLQNSRITTQPYYIAISVFLVLLLVIIMGALYDFTVRQKIYRIIKRSRANRAIVEEFFPTQIRQRLLQADNSTNNAHSMGAATVNALGEHSSGGDDLAYLHAQPIADLFPSCTVAFGDLVGFNAWSSVHEPEQVFQLLESIFQLMDRLARRRRVFKVETIGDTYMAVTGLPDAQPDHALRMARFARDCMAKVHDHLKLLETTLGPDCGELRLRMGMHSGQVTAGVLRGQKTRFQLFGDTVNTAARIESTCPPYRVQVSQATANQLIKVGKRAWLTERTDIISAKGKGFLQTYWLSLYSRRFDDASKYCEGDDDPMQVASVAGSMPGSAQGEEDADWDEDGTDKTEAGYSNLPLSSTKAKTNRLTDWLADLLGTLLKQVIAERMVGKGGKKSYAVTRQSLFQTSKRKYKDSLAIDEVVEAFDISGSKTNSKQRWSIAAAEKIELSPEVKHQLRSFVAAIADRYQFNPFHNFEHCSHVTMASIKLLKRIVVPDTMDAQTGYGKDSHAYGITSNALAQFAIAFCALVHDVDHQGVPNGQLSKEVPELGQKYKNQSIAEQNSVDIAWNLLMSPHFKDLQACVFSTEAELVTFRQYVANLIIATDIFNPSMKTLRNQRWEKAFVETPSDEVSVDARGRSNLKATIVLEHIIQAADVSHTMQHWNVYQKWNRRLFEEMYEAFKAGRAEKDPSQGWYFGELWFFDNYIIPLAQKLEECRVFGVSSDECLNYALENRKEWAIKGRDIVAEYVKEIEKRERKQTYARFTMREIKAFSTKELGAVLRYLIERGRKMKTFEAWDIAGQRSAMRACLDVLEIYYRCPASRRLGSKKWLCDIYSGLIVTMRTGKILHHSDFTFEQNLSAIFLEHTEGFTDDHNVHRLRALALKAEVFYLRGMWKEAVKATNEIEELYDMQVHAPLFFQLYDLDHAIFSITRRPYANFLLGNKDEAIQECRSLIRDVLPKSDPTKLLNRTQMLLPMFAILKDEPGEVESLKNIFQFFVVDCQIKYQIETPAQPIIETLSRLLEVLADPDYISKETIDWVLEKQMGDVPLFLDTICAHFCWCWSTITMELCLRVAQYLHRKRSRNEAAVQKLIHQAYEQSVTTHSIVKGATNEVLLIPAWQTHTPVLRELNEFARMVKYASPDGEDFAPHKIGLATMEPRWRKTETTYLGEVWLAR